MPSSNKESTSDLPQLGPEDTYGVTLPSPKKTELDDKYRK